jgi:hypothetical protein
VSILESLPSDVTLAPQSVAAYLGATGWSLSNINPGSQIWELQEGSTLQARLLLPLDPTYLDFGPRFDEALQKISRVYDWDGQRLIASILGARSDFLYIRADQVAVDGSIPLKQAEAMLTGAHALLLNAASSAVSPRPHYKGRRPGSATDFVNDDVRMGHTQRGSFIITILTRLDEEEIVSDPTEGLSVDRSEPLVDYSDSGEIISLTADGEPSLAPFSSTRTTPTPGDVVIAPFQRRAMAKLATGLQAAQQMATGNNDYNLDEAVRRGLSANLVGAISDMTKFEGLQSLDLSFSWAVAETAARPDVELVEINRQVMPALPLLQERLADRPASPSVETIVGKVIRLERGEDDDEGVVTISGIIERSTRQRAQVRLTGKDYNAAIRAHRSRRPVMVTGTREIVGRGVWLTGEITFEVVPA